MTVNEAITALDTLRHNNIPREVKIAWLSRLDGIIWREVISCHDGTDSAQFSGYDPESDGSEMLLAEEPYDEVYIEYLKMKVDAENAEISKYNNDAYLFNSALSSFKNYYNREHMPCRRADMKVW